MLGFGQYAPPQGDVVPAAAVRAAFPHLVLYEARGDKHNGALVPRGAYDIEQVNAGLLKIHLEDGGYKEVQLFGNCPSKDNNGNVAYVPPMVSADLCKPGLFGISFQNLAIGGGLLAVLGIIGYFVFIR